MVQGFGMAGFRAVVRAAKNSNLLVILFFNIAVVYYTPKPYSDS